MTVGALAASAASSSASAAAAATTSSTARAKLSGNFDTFLTLLTAQLSNQDPLNPVDSAAFTQQLVQYSQVEQQIETNDRLKTLLDQSASSGGAAAVAYIGKNAVLNSSTTHLANGAASWAYDAAGASGGVTLSVRNAADKEVYRTTVPAASGGQVFNWDGKDSSGRPLPDGSYRLAVAAKTSSGADVTPSINVSERITAIDFSGATPNLVTANGARPFDSILSIKN